jgi:hypothetical protein
MNARAQITPCIFGTTSGFEIHTLTRLPLGLEDLAFAIKRDDVELSDRHFCVKTFRLRVNSEVFTWIGLYRKAFEIGFSREGGYYGAGVWLAEITVDSRLAMDVLRDLADQVNALAIEGGRFQRPLSDIVGNIQIPQSLIPLKESTERYQAGGMLPDAAQGAYVCQHESLWQIAEFGQNNVLAERFRSIIAAPAASFPKNPSARLERYSDLTEVVHELASDLSKKIAALDSSKTSLEKHAAALERELSTAHGEIKKIARAKDQQAEAFAKEEEEWSRLYRKLGGPELAVDDGQPPLWLRYVLYVVAAIMIGALLAWGGITIFRDSNEAKVAAARSQEAVFCLSDEKPEKNAGGEEQQVDAETPSSEASDTKASEIDSDLDPAPSILSGRKPVTGSPATEASPGGIPEPGIGGDPSGEPKPMGGK